MAGTKLRRELRMWEAIALSIGIMAPTNAMALNGILPASLAGRAVPLVFLIGFVGVGFTAYAFARLTRYFNHAGSVYVLAGRTLGARAGFFGAFALLGVYVVFAVSGFAATGLFASTFLSTSGIDGSAPWLPIAFASMLVVLWLGAINVRTATRTLLALEAVGVTLIAILIVVIFAKTGSHSAPQHQSFDLHTFVPVAGIGPVIGASVYAFLSWAGFEGAATLGEETSNPLRNIPRTVIYSVAAIGVFYVLTMFAETIGFGTSAAGIKAFGSASAPFSTLSKSYVGNPLAVALDFATTASAFGSALACSAGAARILFALSRDGFGPARLGLAARRTGTPVAALVAVLAACAAMVAGQRIAGTTSSVSVYYYYATIGVLGLLVVYAVTSLGAIRYLFLSGVRRAPLWEIVLPAIGIGYLGYVFYKQVIPVPPAPYNVFPWLVLGWLALGAAIIVALPRLAQKIGRSLTGADRSESELAPDTAVPLSAE